MGLVWSWGLLNFFFLAVFDLYVGVSQVMDCPLHAFGQCGYVERKIRELGSPILGSAILSSCLFSCKLMERWISNPKERSSLWTSIRPQDPASIIENDLHHCHEGVTGEKYFTAEDVCHGLTRAIFWVFFFPPNSNFRWFVVLSKLNSTHPICNGTQYP